MKREHKHWEGSTAVSGMGVRATKWQTVLARVGSSIDKEAAPADALVNEEAALADAHADGKIAGLGGLRLP